MSEIQQIKKKQKQIIYDKYYQNTSVREIPDLIPGDIDGTYCFPDVDYNDQTRSQWGASVHYERIEALLIDNKDKLQNDTQWRECILGAVRYWVCHDFINPNWWHNQIGMPKSMANIALVLENYLTDDLKTGLEKLICRGSFKTNLYGNIEFEHLLETGRFEIPDKWTGANLIWGAAITLKHALWTENEKLLRYAVERIANEMCYAAEGIQPDGAFCQHGPRWYSGGYGRTFVYELAPIICVLYGTSFALPKEKTDILLLHILDGQRAMHKNGYFDFGAVGREYARPGMIRAGTLIPAVKVLSEVDDIARKHELIKFYAELTGQEDDFEVTKFYDSICQLCHKKNGVYIGVRGRTQGIVGAEKCKDEGVLSYNMSYGTVTCVMENGQEYFDISPFWDYSKIPGTTAREENDRQLLTYEGWSSTLETPCIASGKAYENSGILTETSIHDGISVLSAFFVFDGAMVALGADIKDETPHKGKLYTTVEQCRAFNPVIEADYVCNGDICYKNLDDNTAFCSVVECKSGSWSRNKYSAPKENLQDTLLTVTIPVTEYKAYAYLVYRKNEPQVKVLKNDKDCQAIQIGSEKIMAVFHHDGDFPVDGKLVCGKKGEFIFEQI